ncbi:unnamed protein product (macronuclear) [Paramecium tetraurelia]|uniref:Uncharacterized protein n=1 Tax=Paramecium tetraurelia TaxID=5888 RepID=A0BR50_PARTE|nr:uncharacterized protein GSPATT00031246001 [Paramecium tetraurelia]CAK61017.1 unnamed protein product [Paramecium tetraurelia]|eukprot:XP_001428415.1 hypothetical protein (macronuclear) [Paramecium tetraurelia strain d4-2]
MWYCEQFLYQVPPAFVESAKSADLLDINFWGILSLYHFNQQFQSLFISENQQLLLNYPFKINWFYKNRISRVSYISISWACKVKLGLLQSLHDTLNQYLNSCYIIKKQYYQEEQQLLVEQAISKIPKQPLSQEASREKPFLRKIQLDNFQIKMQQYTKLTKRTNIIITANTHNKQAKENYYIIKYRSNTHHNSVTKDEQSISCVVVRCSLYQNNKCNIYRYILRQLHMLQQIRVFKTYILSQVLATINNQFDCRVKGINCYFLTVRQAKSFTLTPIQHNSFTQALDLNKNSRGKEEQSKDMDIISRNNARLLEWHIK